MFLFHFRSFLLAVIMTLSTLLSRYVDNKIESDKKLLQQTFRNDSSILTKIDFRRPVNFLIHGWLGGLNGGYQHIPSVVKPTKGWRAQSAANRIFLLFAFFMCVCVCGASDKSTDIQLNFTKKSLKSSNIFVFCAFVCCVLTSFDNIRQTDFWLLFSISTFFPANITSTFLI